MFNNYRFTFYTDTGNYMGWTPWALDYIDCEVRSWIRSGNAIKFNGIIYNDLKTLEISVLNAKF